MMKWDIMDAYYPLCMSSADMLRSGKLPLWNAALQFGTPAYVMLGIPYWYPTTLFLEITTGYSLKCVAVDYCFHIMLACYGMFLLAKSHLDAVKNKYIIAAIIGGLYGFSGLFISNAQHIMIIISAAWLPYILFFVKRFCETNSNIFILTAAMCMGLSILGGYPEIWIATFIILIPYFLIHFTSDKIKILTVLKAAYLYIILVVVSFSAAAISIIPFVMSSKYIDRLNGGVFVNSYSCHMALSSILPHYTTLSGELGDKLDISMISMFMGLLTILLYAFSLFIKIKYKWKYLGIGFFAFLMMLGSNAFLHPLFYNYFPMFNSLRFPSTWRCILTLFMLLLSAEALGKILENGNMIKIFSMVCALAGIVSLYGYRLLEKMTEKFSMLVINGFRTDLKMDSVIFFAYAVVFSVILFLKKKGLNVSFLIAIVTVADIFVGQYCLYPLTATAMNQWDFEELRNAQAWIQENFVKDKVRTHSIEYSNAERTKSGLNSTGIILGHTLDEEGYLSVLLNYVQNYKTSIHCALSSEVPVVYFTNDMVDNQKVNYNEWIQDENISPYQIFIEQNIVNAKTDRVLHEEVKAQYFTPGKVCVNVCKPSEGCLVVQQSYYPGWNVYVDGTKAELLKVNGTFLGVWLDEGDHTIEFVFRPWDFYIGAMISLTYLVLFFVVLIFHLRKKYYNRNEHKDFCKM